MKPLVSAMCATIGAIAACSNSPPPVLANQYFGVEFSKDLNDSWEYEPMARVYAGYEFDYNDEISTDVSLGYTRPFYSHKFEHNNLDLNMGFNFKFSSNFSIDTDVDLKFLDDYMNIVYNVDFRRSI